MVIPKSLLQVLIVAKSTRNKAALPINHPSNIVQIITGVHYRALVPFVHTGDTAAFSRNTLREHRPVARPRIFGDVAPVIKGIPWHVGKRVPQIPIIIQVYSLDVHLLQHIPQPILPSHPHGVHTLYFFPIGISLLLAGGKYNHMAMIGDYSIDHHHDIFPSGTDADDLHHSVIVLVIPKENPRFHPLHTHVERMEMSDCTVRHLLCHGALHD